MSRARELVRWPLFSLYRLLPKLNYAVVYGWPDFEDSTLALEAGLSKSAVSKVILLVSGKETASRFPLSEKTTVVPKNSLKGIVYFLFARYLFFNHRCFLQRFPANVVSVNVWHGMPIKRIGWLLPGEEGIASRYALATSLFWKEIMQQSMRPYGKTLVTGLPRNDRLFLRTPDLPEKLGIREGSGIRKIVAWLPTYRRSVRGGLRLDGVESESIFGLPGLEPETLNAALAQRGILIFLKVHPLAELRQPICLSNLIVADDGWLNEHSVTLYELLGQTDLLISDISSVVVDYLLTEKPVLHCFPDLAEYTESRGFSFSPVTDYFVGPSISSFEGLLDSMDRIFAGDDPWQSRRAEIRWLFHEHHDAHATQRLLDRVIR